MTTEKCSCGNDATTEVQTGWNPNANNGVGGGQYEGVCEECYSQTSEAAYHAAQYAEIVQDVHYGLYVRNVLHGHERWTGPMGRSFNEEIYYQLLTDPYGVHE